MSKTGLLVAVILIAAACDGTSAGQLSVTTSSTSATSTSTPSPSTTTSSSVPPGTTTTTSPIGELLVVGDFGTGTSDEYEVADAMRQWAATHDVAALLTTGNYLYTSDIDATWTEPYGWLAESGIPVWVTWGTNDVQRPDVINTAFNDPPHWATYHWGNATIIILDSTQIGDLAQEHWLDEQLDALVGALIVAEHNPALACSSQGDTASVLSRWAPKFADAGVVAVLSGHDSNYQRFEFERVTYVVTGGGGESVDALEDCPEEHPERLAGAAEHHFLAISQVGKMFSVDVVGVDGELIDQFVLSR